MRRHATCIAIAAALAGAFPSIAGAQQRLHDIPHGADSPRATVVDPVGNRVFLTDDAGNLTVIDGRDDTVGSAGTARFSTTIALDPAARRLYRGGAAIAVLDLDSLAEHELPGAGVFLTSAVDVLHGEAYFGSGSATAGSPQQVVVVDVATEQARTIAIDGRNPVSIAVDPLGRRAANAMLSPAGSGNAPVAFVDIASNTASARALPDADAQPGGISVNPLTGFTYVTDVRNAAMVVMNPAGAITQRLAVNANPRHVLLDPVGRVAWFASQGPDLQFLSTTGTINVLQAIGAGAAQEGLAFDTVSRALYAQLDNGTLLRVGATGAPTTIAASGTLGSMAVNPLTHRVYLHRAGGTTVVDGTREVVSTLALGGTPGRAALDPVSGRVAVLDAVAGTVKLVDVDGNVTATAASGATDVAIDAMTGRVHVLDRAANRVTILAPDGAVVNHVAVPAAPAFIAVDSVRGRTLVAGDDGKLSVIDAAGGVATIATGTAPVALAVDESTGTAYVLGAGAIGLRAVRVDGTMATIAVGTTPVAMALDPVNGRLFVANSGSGDVTIVTLATLARTNVAIGGIPDAIAVNTVTGRAYVSRRATDRIVEIAPAGTTRIITLAADAVVASLAVDASTNTVFATDGIDSRVHVIDGISLASHVVATGNSPRALLVDPARHRAYTLNIGAGNVTAVDRDAQSPLNPLTVATTIEAPRSIAPVARFDVDVDYGAGAPSVPVVAVYYQVDGVMGRWQRAPADGPTWRATLPGLSPGTHTVFAFAIDALSGTSYATGDRLLSQNATVATGRITATPIVVAPNEVVFANGFE